MARRALTSNNAPTIDMTVKVGLTYEGTLLGVRGIDFGFDKRKGEQDIRWIGDFADAGDAAQKGANEDGQFSSWLATQLRNLLVDTTSKQLKVPAGSRLWMTYTGTVPTKGGGNPTHIFDVEIDDQFAGEPAPAPAQEPHEEARDERELVAARGRSRK